MNRYPYPVLEEENSSYIKDIVFELTYIRTFIVENIITFEFNIKMNSNYIKKLIDDEKAKIILKAQTGFYAESFDVKITDGNIKITILLDNIESNDTLKFVCYILANSDMCIEKSEEMIEIYDIDYKVWVKKYDVLGISNTENLSYSTNNNDFIKFSVSEEQNGKGYAIEYKTNFINVRVGSEFNGAYGIVKNNKREACTIFDCHFVFEVLVYVLIDLVQRFDELYEEQWYKLFEQLFLQTGEYKSVEEFLKSARDDEILNLSVIYKLAHIMVNNQIENTIIAISKIEEA